MNEGQTTTGERTYPDIDAFCSWVRVGLHKVADSVTPPTDVSNHFREARIEVLRGIRAMLDHRIDRLSRRKTGGTTVVVE